ncbi:MAG: aminomethyl-transferring glycine dehydrogenase [Acidimicrobiia bacterium]|nr:aminomethyl-transferring glycine dehydrogenase [Acidimicrobiia bacterium]
MASALRDQFVDRHIGPDAADQVAMLSELGYETLDALTDAAVPAPIRRVDGLDLPPARSEVEAIAALRDLADRNSVKTSLIGMGYSDTITPAVIRRNVLENPAWYTAYTPYQPEIAQGRLEALLDFQTMVADLTGMDLANASLLDEATAAAEAMAMCRRMAPKGGDIFFVDADCHPQTIAVVAGRAEPLGIEIVVGDPARDLPRARVFGVLLQYPGSGGEVRDDAALIAQAHDDGAMVAVAADLLALTLLRSPGAIGADLVVGSAQRFGVPLGYGGPHAAFIACRDANKRTLPGRLVGMSVDAAGRPALRLALQTREQHIRREKATSNICTAQVLLAVIAGLYAVYHGPEGLEAIARRVHGHASRIVAGLRAGGVEVVNESWFDTLTVRVPGRADAIAARAVALGMNLRVVDADTLGISVDETTTEAVVDQVFTAFEVASVGEGPSGLPAALVRTEPFLTHEVFHRYRSETDMLRYLRRLSDRDLALDRTMIPLGSCTMKLNATTEMEPITWPEFAGLHPFAPVDQAVGYHELITDLERWLCVVTGYDAVSLQPNAGSQGELAGLLAIRAYHQSRGERDRTVCLIPASAHGTNAASAVMAGMRVIVVATDTDGNIDLADLKEKATANADVLGALMVTYPSTHGVFETSITQVCDLIHECGGQVYVDGANLNALVGLAAPGQFGADVSHLNLHKTFCIPHGGGGPGVGPVAVRAHLAPFLPGHPLDAGCAVPAVAAAPYGSAGILPIPWAYIAMMGGDGLTTATQVAILSANYLAQRLGPHYPVLYTGPAGLVAHECILDLRPITDATGVTAEDVAKRLIDYGFHAPTLSFPVAGTLMVEPTESESRAELDRFCAAMIGIREEIGRIERGEWSHDASPLAAAPHTAEDVATDAWDREYSRDLAAYPVPSLRGAKYWPPVSRIDGVFGDRNVVCSCAPISAYADE